MRTKVGAQGGQGGIVCRVLVHSETSFYHLASVVGIKYFPSKGTHVFTVVHVVMSIGNNKNSRKSI
jgi:hypothetical protein